jgi:CheY-like chemotaxis protein
MSARPAPAKSVATPTKRDAEERRDDARTPVCLVADVDGSIRHFLSLVLHGGGIDTEEFADGATFRAALARRAPDLVFLNIALESAEAIECVVALGSRGYSSLVQLKELPFAELKLDRAFVTDCGTDKVNAPLCKTVIDLAHNFGSMAVAIGIEKASDALALVSMGCDYGQGFLLGQPMPEERFISLLRQRAASQGRQLAARRGADARVGAKQIA